VSVESLDCLLHTSEISNLRVSAPEEIFTIGEEVTDNIIEIDNKQKSHFSAAFSLYYILFSSP
jgi:small subunit ribosomal protein S1